MKLHCSILHGNNHCKRWCIDTEIRISAANSLKYLMQGGRVICDPVMDCERSEAGPEGDNEGSMRFKCSWKGGKLTNVSHRYI